MSLNQILLHEPDYPPLWSNLSVMSLRARSISVLPIVVGTVETVYLSPAGSDANSGLTSLLPVLTFERAIEVASTFSAEKIVFQLLGTGNVSGFIDTDRHITGYSFALDFTGLSCRSVSIVGRRIDETFIDPGLGTATPAAPFDYWTTVTGLSDLTLNMYDKGLVHSSGDVPLYATSYDNTANAISLITHDGVTIVDEGFDIFNLPGLYILLEESVAVLSKVPVVFQDISIMGSSTAGQSLINLTGDTIYLRNCRVFTHNEGCFSGGVWNLEGCYVEGGTSYLNQLVASADLAVLDINNCQLQRGVHFMQYESKLSNIFTINYQLLCRGSNINIVGLLSNSTLLAAQDNVIIQGSTGYINNALMYNDVDGLACINLDAAILKSSNLELIVNIAATTRCVKAKSSTWYHEGDCTLESTSSSCILLDNSTFHLLPSQVSLAPINRFVCTGSNAIEAFRGSCIALQPQGTKDDYIIESGTSVAVELNASRLIIDAVQASGPDLSTPALQTMISAKNGSIVHIKGTGYVNDGDGTTEVEIGGVVLAPTTIGAAVDVVPTAGVIAASSEVCYLIVYN